MYVEEALSHDIIQADAVQLWRAQIRTNCAWCPPGPPFLARGADAEPRRKEEGGSEGTAVRKRKRLKSQAQSEESSSPAFSDDDPEPRPQIVAVRPVHPSRHCHRRRAITALHRTDAACAMPTIKLTDTEVKGNTRIHRSPA
ncbi:hypothetical protein THAOC_31112 [Thalassiosira oceanica]|uniref:Uncharacterized protein n=1 Tax=Thalassiosira oceanica TaxID=159749 RepID=K0RTE0_THAOC|nr:hypothetical protein THAOC_31112 [Thalassiosira oceanica]|eukprot:EJK49957.1 hypothetical protein THAOC_31112 [Thalassiosira oceanica]